MNSLDNSQNPAHDIEVFFDGGCPLCLREVSMLRRWDNKGKIRFIDIDDPTFQAEEVGKSYEELMAKMHARLPDGTWLVGVEVFRKLYEAVGFRYLTALSRLPVISQFLDVGYWVFAKNRLRLTGRCSGQSCATRQASSSTSI